MNKRIRYIKSPTNEGAMVGSKFYKDENGTEFEVGFAPDGDKYVGYVIGNGVLSRFTASSPHKIKLEIKKTLIGLGCKFEVETRKGQNED